MKILATDLDGTLFIENTLIQGVLESIRHLYESGFKIYFTTNNSSQTLDELKLKLEKLLNLPVDLENIVTPLLIFDEQFKNKFKQIYVYGSPQLKNYIKSMNKLSPSLKSSDCILLGRKEKIDNIEINKIINQIKNNKKEVLCLNKDLTYPGKFNELPGNGTVVKIIEDELNIDIKSLGKPGDYYSSYFIKKNIKIDYVVGDRVDTDILFGNSVNAVTFLVKTGVVNTYSENLANHVVENFSEFVSFVS